MTHKLKLKRIYEAISPDDGYRVLVDRIWPRGVSKEKAKLDEWMKEIAPSHELRKWFNHDPEKFPEFRRRYKMALASNQDVQKKLTQLKHLLKKDHVTLLYAAKDKQHNQAVILKEVILSTDDENTYV